MSVKFAALSVIAAPRNNSIEAYLMEALLLLELLQLQCCPLVFVNHVTSVSVT